MVIGGVTSLGQASSQTGLATWLAESALGGLADWNAVALIAAISAFTVVIHLMLPIAPVINAVMIPPIMVLGAAAGVNSALYALPVIFTASCAFLLPLDAVPLVTYSRGYYRMFDMLPAGLVISAVWVVLMTALLIGIGPLVGCCSSQDPRSGGRAPSTDVVERLTRVPEFELCASLGEPDPETFSLCPRTLRRTPAERSLTVPGRRGSSCGPASVA